MAGDAKNIQMNEFRVWHLHFFRNDFGKRGCGVRKISKNYIERVWESVFV